MAKFCGKCGSPLDENTGLCPQCDKEIINTASHPDDTSDKKSDKTEMKADKKKSKAKKVCITVVAVILAVIIVGIGAIGFLVYSGKLNIPFVNAIFVSVGLKEEDSVTPPVGDGTDDENADNETPTGTDDQEMDLKDNYEVPAFDAEKYFKENTTLKSKVDAQSSQNISTESEAYTHFAERGFTGNPITYEYTMDGTYVGACEISQFASSRHPMYQTYYTTANGDVWMVLEVNGSFFASPISYNFADETRAPVMLSEADTITSYDSTTNAFYVNIPNSSQAVIKTVARIDAETLEKLTGEEMDK